MQDHVRSLRILYWGFQCVRNIKNVGSHGEDRLSNWVLYTIFSIGLKSCPRCCTSDAYCSFKWQGTDKVSGFYAFEPKFLLAPHSKAGDLIRSVQCQDNSQLPDHHGLMLGFNYPLASWHFLKAALISFNISFILMPFLKEKKKAIQKKHLEWWNNHNDIKKLVEAKSYYSWKWIEIWKQISFIKSEVRDRARSLGRGFLLL